MRPWFLVVLLAAATAAAVPAPVAPAMNIGEPLSPFITLDGEQLAWTMTEGIRNIRMPLSSQPWFAEPGESMPIHWWTGSDPALTQTPSTVGDMSGRLILRDDPTWWYPLENLTLTGGGARYVATATIPEAATGLYDLEVTATMNGVVTTDRQPRAVQVYKEYPAELRIAHLTDVHIGGVRSFGYDPVSGGACTNRDACPGDHSGDATEADPSHAVGWARYANAIAEVNLLRPDVVVISGDLVGQSTEAEFIESHRMLQRFDVPTLVGSGNHDNFYNGPLNLDGQALHWKYFGPLHYYRDLGDYRFISVNSYDWGDCVECQGGILGTTDDQLKVIDQAAPVGGAVPHVEDLTKRYFLHSKGTIGQAQADWLLDTWTPDKALIVFQHHNMFEESVNHGFREKHEFRRLLTGESGDWAQNPVLLNLAGHTHWDEVVTVDPRTGSDNTTWITTTSTGSQFRHKPNAYKEYHPDNAPLGGEDPPPKSNPDQARIYGHWGYRNLRVDTTTVTDFGYQYHVPGTGFTGYGEHLISQSTGNLTRSGVVISDDAITWTTTLANAADTTLDQRVVVALDREGYAPEGAQVLGSKDGTTRYELERPVAPGDNVQVVPIVDIQDPEIFWDPPFCVADWHEWNATATDNSGHVNVTFRVDGSLSTNWTPVGEGLAQVVATAADSAGNLAQILAAVHYDTIPARLALDWGDGIASGTVADASCGQPHAATLALNGENIAFPLPGDWSLPLDLPPGRHVLTLSHNDIHGRVSEMSKTFIVRIPPAIIADTPPPIDQTTSGVLHVPVQVEGLTQPAVTAKAWGQTVTLTGSQNRFSIPFPLGLTPGEHKILIEADDGERSIAREVPITVHGIPGIPYQTSNGIRASQATDIMTPDGPRSLAPGVNPGNHAWIAVPIPGPSLAVSEGATVNVQIPFTFDTPARVTVHGRDATWTGMEQGIAEGAAAATVSLTAPSTPGTHVETIIVLAGPTHGQRTGYAVQVTLNVQDTTPPRVTLHAPECIGGPTHVAVHIADSSNTSLVLDAVPGAMVDRIVTPPAAYVGVQRIKAFAEDSAGNRGKAELDILVDQAAPSITAFAVDVNDGVLRATHAAEDLGCGQLFSVLRVNDDAYALDLGQPLEVLVGPGSHEVQLTVSDGFRNATAARSVAWYPPPEANLEVVDGAVKTSFTNVSQDATARVVVRDRMTLDVLVDEEVSTTADTVQVPTTKRGAYVSVTVKDGDQTTSRQVIIPPETEPPGADAAEGDAAGSDGRDDSGSGQLGMDDSPGTNAPIPAAGALALVAVGLAAAARSRWR